MIPVPEKRIARFEKLGLGMFVHWGLYSLIGKGEWFFDSKTMPMTEYEKLMGQFTAEDFDGRGLARFAKKSGMKYIVLTTRHHDGFSLYDTCGLNEYDAPHSACGRDLVREFVDGCRAEGIVPFFYHTTLDWHNPDFENDFDKYQEYLRRSVEILCTNYGEIGGLWFDGNWSKPADAWDEDALYSMIRKKQPNAMIINNTGLSARGFVGNSYIDSVTFEQGRPSPINREGAKKYVAAEMCQTINTHWGIGKNDFMSKSLPYLIETLCACRRYGANYLLNIGPAASGAVTPFQQAMLEELGRWISISGDALYDGTPTEIVSIGKDFALNAGGKTYLFIHDLSTAGSEHVVVGGAGIGPRAFKNVQGKIKNIKWHDNSFPLDFTQDTANGLLCVNCNGYDYGENLVVRVAEIDYE